MAVNLWCMLRFFLCVFVHGCGCKGYTYMNVCVEGGRVQPWVSFFKYHHLDWD